MVLLDTTDQAGASLRQRMLKIEEMGEPRDPAFRNLLETADPPPAGLRLWDVFWAVRNTVDPSLPVGLTDWAAWAHLTGLGYQPGEIQILMAMDRTYLSAKAEMALGK